MKLNYRDKVILGIILAIVIAVLGFVFMIKPKNEEIKTDEETLKAKQTEQAELETKIARIEPLKKSIEETYEETAKMTEDFVDIEDISSTEKLDKFLREYAEECGVRIDELNVAYPKEKVLKYYYLEYEDLISNMRESADLNGMYSLAYDSLMAEQNALKDRTAETLIQTQYGIRVTGTREAVWKYMKTIEDLKKSILIDEVDIADYSFGANTVEDTASEPAETPEEAGEPTDEGAEAENPAEGENPEVPAPAEAPAPITISNSDTSSVEIVMSLYSVYDMQKPDIEEE
ncbi:MAG: hypothetical protein K2J08_06930 [Ruminococcus sp.]|nr:hypothetical protein [Ruminococcus sp.]